MFKVSKLLIVSSIFLSSSASAAHWCSAYVDAVIPGPKGITVYSTSSYNGDTLDPMFKEYGDPTFGGIYMRALDAERNRYEVRLYPVSGRDEEDGARCNDGTPDYLRTLFRPHNHQLFC